MLFKARTEELVFESLGDELLIYDMERHLYHHLNRTAALVWKMCDGSKDVAYITEVLRSEISADSDEQTVRAALSMLADANLLQEIATDEQARETRRAFLKSAVSSGRTALLAATISTIVAPTITQAQSTCSVAGNCGW